MEVNTLYFKPRWSDGSHFRGRIKFLGDEVVVLVKISIALLFY